MKNAGLIMAGIFLFICTLTDLRERSIHILPAVCTALAAGVWRMAGEGDGPAELIFSFFPAAFCLMAAFLSRQGIGYGDALAAAVLGICTGAEFTLGVLLAAFTLAAVTGGLYCLIRHVTWKTELPFAPFLFAGFLLVLAAGLTYK